MQTYSEEQAELKAEQASMSPQEIKQLMDQKSEFSLDLNNLPTQEHHWVDRGVVISCEGGTHPYHQMYKRR